MGPEGFEPSIERLSMQFPPPRSQISTTPLSYLVPLLSFWIYALVLDSSPISIHPSPADPLCTWDKIMKQDFGLVLNLLRPIDLQQSPNLLSIQIPTTSIVDDVVLDL